MAKVCVQQQPHTDVMTGRHCYGDCNEVEMGRACAKKNQARYYQRKHLRDGWWQKKKEHAKYNIAKSSRKQAEKDNVVVDDSGNKSKGLDWVEGLCCCLIYCQEWRGRSDFFFLNDFLYFKKSELLLLSKYRHVSLKSFFGGNFMESLMFKYVQKYFQWNDLFNKLYFHLFLPGKLIVYIVPSDWNTWFNN